MPLTHPDPAVVPLQALGVIDVGGTDVPNNEVLAHALSNSSRDASREFAVRRGGAFVNEYPRTTGEQKSRTDGGYEEPNHLLGSFPVLFPYGMGGFEVNRKKPVSYEAHIKWALQYEDKRFRKDLHFVFQVFGVLQKRQVCRSASLQIQRSLFVKNQAAIQAVTPADLLKASAEEGRKAPYSNPGVRALRQHVSAVRVQVQGTDESRRGIRSEIWSTTLMLNPPSLWLTINPSDTNDPIAQIMAGAEINMDDFEKMAGPDSNTRSTTIAADPFVAAKFFHFIVNAVLEELFGIKSGPRGLTRREGILGEVSAYVGAVEAQGRGTLHLHMVLWLTGAPTSAMMKEALKSSKFRDKVRTYIDANIRADIGGASTAEVAAMPRAKAVGYSRPVDPRKPNYKQARDAADKELAKALQLHTCSKSNCLKLVKDRLLCKWRAPFELSSRSWIDEGGDWGPKRLAAYLNNWCPPILQCLRSNHDIKLITNGAETKDITWYITCYTAKKQQASSNTSALLAKRLAFHRKQEARNADITSLNKKLIQRCANTLSREQEFSAPEVISYLMGWGDRYISHHFVSVYWDNVTAALKRRYPGLCARW